MAAVTCLTARLISVVDVFGASAQKPTSYPFPLTPQPIWHTSGPRIPPSFETVDSNNVTENAELDRRRYGLNDPIRVRFTVTNRTSHSLGFIAIPDEYASFTLRDSNGSIVPYNLRVIHRSPILHIPATKINAGETITTPWYPLTLWGIAPTRKGIHTLEFVPQVTPTYPGIRRQSDGATALTKTKILFLTVH